MKRTRNEICEIVGKEYLQTNIENDEWKYSSAFNKKSIIFNNWIKNNKGRKFDSLDIRFVKNDISVLVETKKDFLKDKDAEKQLSAYVTYEKVLTGNKIIAILANTNNETIKVWRGPICKENLLKDETKLRSFEEYANFYQAKANNKELVIKNTYTLNELLEKHSVPTTLRAQFVGSCLLALKNNLKYEASTSSQILVGIRDILATLLNKNLNKADKLVILDKKVLDNQGIKDLSDANLREVLHFIEKNILPYINDKSTAGQDLLNLFFVQFNKYSGRADKNQAFTPDHITEFMSKAININRNSYILDPCCGSGSFLVRAMNLAMDDCATKKEMDEIKDSHIYGIEYEEVAFGLATTNMLIHSDGNSNVIKGSCFECEEWIQKAKIDCVLMNPPYNAQRKHVPDFYSSQWDKNAKEDPSKGLFFVQQIAKYVKKGYLATLLPLSCASEIKESSIIGKLRNQLLEENTLDAVFTLPKDLFHPGANVQVCCMIFKLGVRHNSPNNLPTFFGYYKDDGFYKKKKYGRIEKIDDKGKGQWKKILSKWLDIYQNRKEVKGLSAVKKVGVYDEWLAEAYMDTDYSLLNQSLFEKKIRDYCAFRFITEKGIIQPVTSKKPKTENLDMKNWKEYYINYGPNPLFKLDTTSGSTTDDLMAGNDIPYIAAKKDINGFKDMYALEGNEEYVSKGNCIVFVTLGDGSAGYTTYQKDLFIGMKGKTSCGYNDNLNVFTGLFLSTILDLERPKYCFGRSWASEKLDRTKVLLPTKDNQIDWKWMENYIKSLQYSEYLY